MKVLVACEYSGIVRDAFITRGHDAMSCDLLPTESSGPHFQGDIREVLYEDWDLIIAHPPCTFLTLAGNKWYGEKYKDRFPNRQNDLLKAIEFFNLFTDLKCQRVAIENPIGRMSTVWRKPDQIIQPYQFGHDARKPTCLWLKNLPKIVETNRVPFTIHTTKSGKTMSTWHVKTGSASDKKLRAHLRSATFRGIAEAMAQQWVKS